MSNCTTGIEIGANIKRSQDLASLQIRRYGMEGDQTDEKILKYNKWKTFCLNMGAKAS